MKLNDIALDSYVEIIIRRNGYNYRIVSRVDYQDENCIGVTPIASTQRLFQFQETDEVTIIYRHDDKYWRWEHVKAGIATREDGNQMHVFKVSGRASVYNRRSQFRFNVGVEITLRYEVLDTRSDLDFEMESYSGRKNANRTPELDIEKTFITINERYREIECRAYLKDLSEGGASIETDVRLEKGAFVSFTLDSDEGTVFLRGVIVRVSENKRGYFDNNYGCSFIETSKNYVKYFYSQQRKQLYESSKSDQ